MENNEKIEYIATHYSKLMHAAANSILNDYHESEDACQEALLRLYRVADILEDVRSVRTRAYCVTAARNTAVIIARKKAKQIPCEVLPNDSDKDEFLKTYTAEAEEMINDIDELPEKYRNIIRLRCFENRSAAETAELMNSNISTVNSQLLRARELLKNKWISIACLCCGIVILSAALFHFGVFRQQVYYTPVYSPGEAKVQEEGCQEITEEGFMQKEQAASGKSLSDSRLFIELDRKALEEIEGAEEKDIIGRELIEGSETDFIYEVTVRYDDRIHEIRMRINGEIISHEIR